LPCANGQNLSYDAHSFDLTMKFKVFLSVLDDEVKHNLAHELFRMIRPGGMIVWYDFWVNHSNM
jgi:hypothetical protein